MLSRRGISFAVSVIFVLVLIVIGAFVAIEYNAMNGGKITSTTQSVTDTTSIVRTTSVATPVDVFNIGKWVASVNTDSYQPDDVTFNSNLSEIYLSGFPSPNITIVDPETHNASGTLTMPGIDAEHIVVDPKTDTLVVWVVTCNRPNANSSSCSANYLNTTAVEVN